MTRFISKFIVMSDGSVGINITKPRAALDVRGGNVTNRPSAILGARALGTHVTNSAGLVQYHTQGVVFVPSLAENGYNQIAQSGDQGMFFTDGKGIDGANQTGDFVLAPWVENRNAAIGGMRMDEHGNTEFHGSLRATELKVNSSWWSDFVFDTDYELISLPELDSFISIHHHLPEMPSEKEVIEDGIDVQKMLALQQQKIEELTLYILNLQKQIKNLQE